MTLLFVWIGKVMVKCVGWPSTLRKRCSLTAIRGLMQGLPTRRRSVEVGIKFRWYVHYEVLKC